MEEQANIQRLLSALLMLSLNGHSVISGNGLPWYTDMNRDGALVTYCMFH